MENKPTVALLIVCIASLTAVFFTSLMDLAFIVVTQMPYEEVKHVLEESGAGFTEEQIAQCFNVYSQAPYHLVFNILELVGVVLLMKRKYIGFHLYAASQIGFCYVSYLAFGIELGASLIFFDLLWVLIYFYFSRNLSSR